MYPTRLRHLLSLTRLSIWWERHYAIYAPVFSVLAIWAGLSLIGVWSHIPPWLHGLSLIGVLALAIGVGVILRQRVPSSSKDAAYRRLEQDSDLPRGLIQDLADQPFKGDDTSPLWQRHQARLAEIAVAARLQKPRALIRQTDPFALRYTALTFVGIGVVIAGSQTLSRLQDGLWPAFGSRTTILADVWIEPPAYTGLPPTFLVRSGPLPTTTEAPVDIPEGSIFRAQISRPDGKPVSLHARIATAAGKRRLDTTAESGTAALEKVLSENAAIEIKILGRSAIWPISVTQDQPPLIAWQADPETKGGTRTLLSVTVDDDYGVAEASLLFSLGKDVTRPPDAPKPTPGQMAAPVEIPLPALRGPAGPRRIDIDLTDHPFAGLPTNIRIKIKDGAGHTATTTPQSYEIPVRLFYNPLARAIVEQRQSLALAPASWRRSARLLDALTFAPDRYARSGREYLLMRSAYHQVFNRAQSDPVEVVASLWPLAISMEDEGLTLARQRLEAAQAALRDALARGASQSEVDQLIEDLRAAMNDYLAALSTSDNAPTTEESADMESADLQDILDEIAELRRQGDTEEARERLAELEELLKNLQVAQGQSGSGSGSGSPMPGQGSGSGNGQGSASGENSEDGQSGEGLSGTGDLINKQRELSDETFSARRQDRSAAGLADEQRRLADSAQRLQQGAQGDRLGQSSDAAEGAYRHAEQMMRDAAEALDRGDLSYAQSLQEEAINALREGGQALAEALREGDTEGDGPTGTNGTGETTGTGSLSGMGAERDPLGRYFGMQGETGIEIPDLSDPERIRSLTQELREKLTDPNLGDAERQYIERLLERF